MKWFRRKGAKKEDDQPRFAPIGGKQTGPRTPRKPTAELPRTRPELPKTRPEAAPTLESQVESRTMSRPAPEVRKPDPKPEPAKAEPRTASPAEVRRAEFALAEGIVGRDFMQAEIQRANAEGTPLGRALLGLDYPDMTEIASILGRVAIPRIDLDKVGPTEEALARLPADIARARDCLPLAIFGNIICVAMARPEDLLGIREIRDVTGRRVKALRAEGAAVRAMIARHYGSGEKRSFRLRPLPISDEAYERAQAKNRLANEAVVAWTSTWVHGEVCEAQAHEGGND